MESEDEWIKWRPRKLARPPVERGIKVEVVRRDGVKWKGDPTLMNWGVLPGWESSEIVQYRVI